MAGLVEHFWDAPEDAGPHDWDAPDLLDSDDEQNPELSRDAAATAHLEILTSLYIDSVLSAEIFCHLCYWAFKAGMPGMVAQYGRRPGVGHYQRHLDEQFAFTGSAKLQYQLTVPASDKNTLGRTTHKMAVVNPHEAIEQEMQDDDSISIRLQEAVDDHILPPSYYDHPLVQAAPDDAPPLPTALYMDGLPYSLTVSVLGVWLVNLITGSRHLLAVVRKRICCRCGCRGWCTYYPLLFWLHWCFRAMGEGVYPDMRHNGQDWFTDILGNASDSVRSTLAGTALKVKSILLQIKGDWAEFCERLGFPTWASVLRPCMCCNGFGECLHDPTGVGLQSLPWRPNAGEDYLSACDQCEFWVELSAEMHARICGLLRYDKRDQGSHGRALSADVPELDLFRDDRLEAHANLLDVGDFDALSDFPVYALFWRSALNSICTRRCPLFDDTLGITPVRTICFDLLHTLFLGVMLVWANIVMARMFPVMMWGEHEQTAEEKLKVAVLMLRRELFQWYHSLSDLSQKMVGSMADPSLKLKAMETFGFVMFLHDLVAKYHVLFGDSAAMIMASGNALIEYVHLLKGHGPRLSENVLIRATDLYNSHMRIMNCFPEFLDHAKPKHHLMFHINFRAAFQGNPWSYTTFLDEGLNKNLKKLLRNCHQRRFEPIALVRGAEMLKRWRRKRPRDF